MITTFSIPSNIQEAAKQLESALADRLKAISGFAWAVEMDMDLLDIRYKFKLKRGEKEYGRSSGFIDPILFGFPDHLEKWINDTASNAHLSAKMDLAYYDFYCDPPIMRGWYLYGRPVANSHLITDSIDLDPLHLFAERIGLKRSWFQDKPGHPHYDLTPKRHAAALKAGAIEVPTIDLIKLLRARNAALQAKESDNGGA